MNEALSSKMQQVGLAALFIGILFLSLGLDRRLVLLAFLVSVLTSSRYAWERIRFYGKFHNADLLAATAVPALVCLAAIAILVWMFEMNPDFWTGR